MSIKMYTINLITNLPPIYDYIFKIESFYQDNVFNLLFIN